MADFNPEFIKRLALGDETAFGEIKDLPLLERMAIGNAVDIMRDEENIVPMSNKMSLYEEKRSEYIDDEAVGEAMQRRFDIERENRERAEKAMEEHIAEQTRQAVNRARSGLPRNGRGI